MEGLRQPRQPHQGRKEPREQILRPESPSSWSPTGAPHGRSQRPGACGCLPRSVASWGGERGGERQGELEGRPQDSGRAYALALAFWVSGPVSGSSPTVLLPPVLRPVRAVSLVLVGVSFRL